MTTGIIVIFLLLAIRRLLFFKTKGQTKIEQPTTTNYSKAEAEKFVKSLDELGYFKFADTSDVDILKAEFIKSYYPEAELTSIWDDNTFLPKDFRYYFCDGEYIYE